MSRQIRVLISGGGTGGHIFPAIAIADALRMEDPSIEILFAGAIGKMEMVRVPQAGYPIRGLWISGFQRRLGWSTFLFPIKLAVSLLQAFRLIRQFKPHMVIGVGGYASGPVLMVATLLGIKTAIQEQNAYPGKTNQFLAGRVNRIYTAFPDMKVKCNQNKIRLVGNPIRKGIKHSAISRTDARAILGLDPGKKTILIFGGSLGAGIFNECMESAFDTLIHYSDTVQWIWQSGASYEDRYKNTKSALLNNVRFVPFIDRMDLAYQAADLVVCRAGAMAISELAVLGKPCILVPSPFVAEDHQSKNAKALTDSDAARMISQSEAAQSLIEEAIKLVHNDELLSRLSENISLFARVDADVAIAKDVLKLIANGKS